MIHYSGGFTAEELQSLGTVVLEGIPEFAIPVIPGSALQVGMKWRVVISMKVMMMMADICDIQRSYFSEDCWITSCAL